MASVLRMASKLAANCLEQVSSPKLAQGHVGDVAGQHFKLERLKGFVRVFVTLRAGLTGERFRSGVPRGVA